MGKCEYFKNSLYGFKVSLVRYNCKSRNFQKTYIVTIPIRLHPNDFLSWLQYLAARKIFNQSTFLHMLFIYATYINLIPKPTLIIPFAFVYPSND